MKTLKMSLTAALVAATLCPAVYAQEPKPATPPAQQGQMGGGMEMGGMNEESIDQHLKNKQAYELKMFEYSQKITNAKDEQERERLMGEQRKLMREQMQAQRQMMQKMMQHRGQMQPGQGMQHGGGQMQPGQGMQHGGGQMQPGQGMQHGGQGGAAPQPPASQ